MHLTDSCSVQFFYSFSDFTVCWNIGVMYKLCIQRSLLVLSDLGSINVFVGTVKLRMNNLNFSSFDSNTHMLLADSC